MRDRVSVASTLLLFCLLVMMTVLPTARSADLTSGTHTFIQEGAEEATYEEWDARWERYDGNNDNISGQDWWCRQMHEIHSGQRSIYCARNGINSHYLNSSGYQPWNVNITSLPPSVSQSNYVLRYDTNQDSILRKSITGAQYYNKVTMTFWFYSDTGASDAEQPDTGAMVGYDFLNAIYYTGSGEDGVKHVLWTDSHAQATARTWIQISIDVPNDATMVGFEFVSGTIAPEGGDASDALSAQGISIKNGGMMEGVFLDDISVVGTDPAPNVPLVTSVDSLPAYETNRSFPVNIVDNDPQVGLKYAYLYYRLAGEVTWTKYTTTLNEGGTFSVFPIVFVAPGDGTYQFFSVGVDQNDVIEEMRNAEDESTIVDASAPTSTIAVTGEETGGSYAGAASFTITSSDATSGIDHISYRIDGGSWKQYVSTFGLAASGEHVVEYYATDKAGNAEQDKRIDITIVNGSSRIIFHDEDMTYPTGDVTINFTVASTATISKLEYSLDGGSFIEIETTAASLSFTELSDGSHSLTIRAMELDDSIIQGQIDFTVGNTTPNVDGSVGDILRQPLALVGMALAALLVIGGVVWIVKRRGA